MAINGAGAACTAVTLVIVLVSKFAEGAWVMVLLIPALLALFLGVRAPLPDRRPARWPPTRRSTPAACSRPWPCCRSAAGAPSRRKALRFGPKISPDVYALHIAGDEKTMAGLEGHLEQRVREPATAAGLAAAAS